MTSHYVEIACVGDEGSSAATIVAVTFERLHLELARRGRGDVAISFPEYSLPARALGNRLRLHGTPDALEDILSGRWKLGMAPYLNVSPVTAAPEGAIRVLVRRRQGNGNLARVARRAEKRALGRGETFTGLIARPANGENRGDVRHLPALSIRSRSTGERFLLRVEVSVTEAGPGGPFSAYGLAATPASTVPSF